MKKTFINVNYENTGIKTIRGIGMTILICGIITSLIIIFTQCFIEVPSGRYGSTEESISIDGLVSAITVFLGSLFFYAVCLLLAHLGKMATIANMQRQKLLEAKGIKYIMYEDATITIKDKENSKIKTISLSYWDGLSDEGKSFYEIVED